MSSPPQPALKWTDEDQQLCLSLMYKARDCGVLAMLMKRVMEPDCGWDVIPMKDAGGAMNDASKRQREEDVSTSYSQKGYGAPMPLPSTAMAMTEVPKLPAGVSSLDDWGRNLITFGKFKGKRSYASLCTSVGVEDVDYKKWLHAHYTNGSPQLRDLVEYLTAMKDRSVVASGDSQGVMIPGTDVPRRYAPWRKIAQ